ncbi:MAG: response regulator transcription factor [Oscillospiraceae bacterium]|nr:response regulator transcription factor [Oscillospiraceae bacterium]
MIQVLIVEDDPMARQLLEIYVDKSDKYSLAGSIDSSLFAEAFCRTHPVDVVLMDVCTAMNANGIDAAERIKKNLPKIKIVIITSLPECSFIDRARAAGVDSFWYKSASAEEIISVMDRTLAGESIYPDNTPSLKLGDSASEQFSERELEVLRLVVGGETDAAIAEKLFISVATVKTHIQNMKNRSGFRNRTELAVKARESGLVIYNQRPEE